MPERKKILALDDQKSMQNILSFALRKDFDVSVVGTSKEALDKARMDKFDFFLLDIVLDNDAMDGIGVAQELQNSGINAPVAFLSSLGEDALEEGQRQRIRALKNVRFYQIKPITPNELVTRVKTVVG
jgi:DNA-binding response OmpR family regulator